MLLCFSAFRWSIEAMDTTRGCYSKHHPSKTHEMLGVGGSFEERSTSRLNTDNTEHGLWWLRYCGFGYKIDLNVEVIVHLSTICQLSSFVLDTNRSRKCNLYIWWKYWRYPISSRCQLSSWVNWNKVSVDTVLMGQSRRYNEAYRSALSSINHLSFPTTDNIQGFFAITPSVLYYERSFYNDNIYINTPILCCRRRNDSKKKCLSTINDFNATDATFQALNGNAR